MEENKKPPSPLPAERNESTLTMSGPRAEERAQPLQVVSRERYLVRSVIDEGGQGRILSAEDPQLGRTVALKELLRPSDNSEARFVREARITARLQHPAIVPVYEAGRWPSGEPFYAMKLVHGQSFDRLIDSLHTQAERLAALPHVLAVAEAIAYAHSQRVIHRDLKPANVLVGEFGETVVVDWGICKELDRHESTPQGAEDTQQGAVVGTPAYLPLEQAVGNPVDERADVYALGAMLYQLLSGHPPYRGKSAKEVLQQVLTQEPTPLAILQPRLPEELLAIVSRAMKREPAHRYPSAREFAEDLKRFLTGQLVGAHNYSVWQRVRRFARQYRSPLTVAAVALVALATGGVLDYWRIRHERDLAEDRQKAAERAEREARQAEHLMAKAEHEASLRADSLALVQARNALTSSPEQALALLDGLSPSFTQWGLARTLAADATSKGLARRLRGHSEAVNSVRFSPDGHWLLTTSQDHTVRLWDMKTGTSRILATHDDAAWFGIFSPDGQYVASSSRFGGIKLWEMATGTSRHLTGSSVPVTGLRFSPESRGLISAHQDGHLRLWDVASGQSHVLGTAEEGISRIAVLPSGSHLVSLAGTTARLWNLKDGSSQVLTEKSQFATCIATASQVDSYAMGIAQGRILLGESSGRRKRTLNTELMGLDAIALSSDGRLMAATGTVGRGNDFKRAVQLWNLERGTSHTFYNAESRPLSLTFSRNGEWLAMVDDAGRIQLLKTATGASHLMPTAGEVIHSVAFSPDQEWLAVASDDSIVRLYGLNEVKPSPPALAWHALSAEAGEEPSPCIVGTHRQDTAAASRTYVHINPWEENEYLAQAVTALAWTPSGGHVLSAGKSDNKVRLSNLAGGSSVEEQAHRGAMTAASVLRDGSRLVTAGTDGTLALWNESGQLLQRLSGPVRAMRVLALASNGAWVAGSDGSGTVWVWEVASGKSRALGSHEEQVLTLTFSPDGKHLASGGREGELWLWDVASGVGRRLHRHRSYLLVSAFSPDGRFLASGSADGTTWLQPLDGAAGRSLSSGHTHTLLFSADGRHLFTGGRSSKLTRWDVSSGKLLGVLSGGFLDVIDMALSPEGQRLATAGRGGSLRLWDLPSGESRALLGHEGDVTRVAFSPDGHQVVSADSRGSMRLWKDDLPLEAEALRAWLHQAANQ